MKPVEDVWFEILGPEDVWSVNVEADYHEERDEPAAAGETADVSTARGEESAS